MCWVTCLVPSRCISDVRWRGAKIFVHGRSHAVRLPLAVSTAWGSRKRRTRGKRILLAAMVSDMPFAALDRFADVPLK